LTSLNRLFVASLNDFHWPLRNWGHVYPLSGLSVSVVFINRESVLRVMPSLNPSVGLSSLGSQSPTRLTRHADFPLISHFVFPLQSQHNHARVLA